MRNRVQLGIAAVIAATSVFLGVASAGADPIATVTGRYVLPDLALGSIVNSGLPGTVPLSAPSDRGMLLGGIGSDLWHGPTDPDGTYWAITDRGPNGEVAVDGANRRTFPVPQFDPVIVQIKTTGAGTISVQKVIAIVGESGKPVTGLSNQDGRDEKPYGWDAKTELAFNPSGLDTEGIVRTSSGEFWLCDEYSPSIIRLDASGKVLARYVPVGLNLVGADYPVKETVPGIYLKRRANRGFEGIALSKDEKTVYAVLQSPLRNPSNAVGDNSLNTRILALDTATGAPVGEWVYQFNPFAQFKAKGPGDMKLSSVVVTQPNVLLINERTDDVAKLFVADLTKATNILGSKWDLVDTSPSLEGTSDLAAAGVVPVSKKLAIDLSTVPGMPSKVEGVAVLSANQIAVINDNDFDINTFDANGMHQPKGTKTSLIELRLSEPIGPAPAPPNTGNTATRSGFGMPVTPVIAVILASLLAVVAAGYRLHATR